MTIQELRLNDLRNSLHGLKKSFHWAAFNGESVIVDRCQYWKNSQPTDYTIMVQDVEKEDSNSFAVRLWVDEDEQPKLIMSVKNISRAYVAWAIKNMWMTVQHLCIKADDGKNIVWTLEDAYHWWPVHLPNEENMIFEHI